MRSPLPVAARARLHRLSARLRRSLPAELLLRFLEADLLTQAAALSFYSLLSLAPLLLLLLWITTALYPSAQAALLTQVGLLAGDEARTVAATVIGHADARPDLGSLAGAWSLGLLLLGATIVFARLQAALNLIFRSSADRLPGVLAWLRKRVLSFGVVLSLGFLLLVSMAMTTALQLALARVPSLLPVVAGATTFALYALAFAFLYHFLPDRHVRWPQALRGGLATAALFALGRWLVGLYLARTAPGSAYGAAGTLVLLLVWMYYAAAIFFCGALVTAVIDERARTRAGGDAPGAGGEPRVAS